MTEYSPSDGKWLIGKRAHVIRDLNKTLSREAYDGTKKALQECLCRYFSSGDCREKQEGISRIGTTEKGGKVLKVRWNYPGCGKRGGLRLVVIAYCEARRVHIQAAFLRKDDPTDDEVSAAIKDM